MKAVVGEVSLDSGSVEFGGRLSHRPMLSEQARDGLFYLPDRELLSRGIRLRDQLDAVSSRFGVVLSKELVRLFGLEHVLDDKPRSFSGGELRRAEICLAVHRQPTCLIADEPLRGIDPKDAELILQQLIVLASSGAAVLVSGHNSKPLLEAADEVVWVTSGTTYQLGSPTSAVANDHFRKEYLLGGWNEASIPPARRQTTAN